VIKKHHTGLVERILRSPRKKRIVYTKKIVNDNIIEGIGYYLDNRMVLMHKDSDNPTVADAGTVIWNRKENSRPDGVPMPPPDELTVSYHGRMRSKERSILAPEIYETILLGIEMNVSNPSVVKRKYFYNDIAVVVVWEKEGLVVTEMSVAPTRKRGFLEQVPLLFEDLTNAGLEWGSFGVINETSFLRMMAGRINNQIVHAVNDWYKKGLRNYSLPKRVLMTPWIKQVAKMQASHEIYDYNTRDGVTKYLEVHPGHTYEAFLLAPTLTDDQKKVLDKWGLSLTKAEEGAEPSFKFRPVSDDRPTDLEIHTYLFDMSQFSGNAHEWAQTKKSCKLTEL